MRRFRPSPVSDMEPSGYGRLHASTSSSDIQNLQEKFDAEEKAEGRGIPIVYANPVDRGVTIVALVGHFCIQRELFCEHVVGTPAESPGEIIAG